MAALLEQGLVQLYGSLLDKRHSIAVGSQMVYPPIPKLMTIRRYEYDVARQSISGRIYGRAQLAQHVLFCLFRRIGFDTKIHHVPDGRGCGIAVLQGAGIVDDASSSTSIVLTSL